WVHDENYDAELGPTICDDDKLITIFRRDELTKQEIARLEAAMEKFLKRNIKSRAEREYMINKLDHAMNTIQDWVIQDPSDYGFEIYINNTRPYPSHRPLFGPPNRPHKLITNYQNFDLLFLKKGSKVKKVLKPSINRAWAVYFDEDNLEEIFEERFRSEVTTKFDLC
ncbi:hypothetical protein Tco_0022957, partial [Tanacetum coccineum]